MADGDDAGTLGETLRRARQQRGLTIAQVAATTRLPARLLEALERNDLHASPGGMYLRAEVLAYADAVGLNRDVALAHLHAAIDPPAAVVAPQRPAAATSGAVRWGVLAAGLCLTIAVLLVWRPDRQWRATTVASSRTSVTSPRSATPSRTAVTQASHSALPPEAAPLKPPAGSATAGDVTPATTDAPPPVAVANAELEIVTEPTGARVTIDGIGWGVTPVTVRYLAPGSKRVRITREGFASEQRVIQFAADQPHTIVQITLRPVE